MAQAHPMNNAGKPILTQEQDELLDLYMAHLDTYFENLKTSEKIQVEIETLHLKRLLTE